MTHEDHTFGLVKSLSMNEKRYFRVSATATGKDKNYLKVFDALDKMKAYDPEKLRRTLKGINLSYEKNYLQKQLLKTLRGFYSDINSVTELQGILHSLEILYRRRLISQCQKLVDKGIELCRRFEQWHYHLELLDWQRRLYARTGNYRVLTEYAKENLRQKQELLKTIHAFSIEQEKLIFVTSVLQQKSHYLSAPERKRFGQLRRSYRQNTRKHAAFRIAEIAYGAQYFIHHYLGDMQQAYAWNKAALELYDAHPQYIFDQPFKYFVTCFNLVTRCIHFGKHEEALEHLKEIEKRLSGLSAFDRKEVSEEFYSGLIGWKARIYFKMRQPAEALKAAKEFERQVNFRQIRQNQRSHVDYSLARIYFTSGMHRESLKYVNKQIREGAKGLKLEYLLFAFLLRLCIYVEQDAQVLIMPTVSALERFLNKNRVKDAFADEFTAFIKKYVGAGDDKAQRALVAKNFSKLKKLVSANTEQYEVILRWLKTKM